MADLNDRGQLLLAGAFVLAVSLIGLTIVFTSGNYTSALASQENDVVRGSDAVAIRQSVEADLTRQFEYVFDAYDDNGDRKDEFEKVINSTGNEMNNHYSRRGRIVNVTRPDSSDDLFIEGSRIKQRSPSNFDKGGGLSDWMMAENVEVRNITFKITSLSSSARDHEDGINISFDTPASAGGNWSMTLHRDASTNTVVRTRSPNGKTRKCKRSDVNAGSNTLYIDLDAGTIDGVKCKALLPIDPGRNHYDINITRGAEATGKYWMIVDKPPSSLSYGYGPSELDSERILYGARVNYRYHSSSVAYETKIDVAPDELS